MKKCILFFYFGALLFPCLAFTQSHEEAKTNWDGLVRFKPVSYVALILEALPLPPAPQPTTSITGIFIAHAPPGTPLSVPLIDFVPHVSREVGIPITLDFGFSSSTYEFGVESGVEISPIRSIAPAGFLFSVKAGLKYIYIEASSSTSYAHVIPYGSSVYVNPTVGPFDYFEALGKIDLGYQFITKDGFVFMPAIGLAYDMPMSPPGGMPSPPISILALDLMLDVGFAYKCSPTKADTFREE
jgi:hypothetical protein